ncbi:hypothetical protein [Flavobacterium sp. N2820]|uniref:hypothetical protein n=1 Tax=Flavobacterium sp. N2820 TaxID=2986834 RepID=UPI0022249852|nr:hypothetical protein [Flavobacterium sp. N2820]
MRLKIILILLMFFNINSFAQLNPDLIVGRWIKFDAEMRDGSKLLPRPYADSTYFEFTISRDKLSMNSNPLTKGKPYISYKLKDNYLKTSETSGYTVERISKDTLILCERIDGQQNDRLKCYHLIREETLNLNFLQKYQGKKEIVATKLFTPLLKGDIQGAIFKELGDKNISNYHVIGNLKIYKEKKITAQIIESSTNDSTKINIITRILENSYDKWDFKNFSQFDKIIIPFVLRVQRTTDKGIGFKGINILYHTHDLEDVNRLYGPKISDLSKALELYDEGTKAYSKGKYLKAAELFSQSYELNPQELDGLYNKAIALFQGGDKTGACKVWEELVKLGQTNGKEMYKTYCN